MKNILITGATGFLGKYLVKEFSKDHNVYAMGRNTSKRKELESLGATFCECDFTNKKECEIFFKDIDYVVHSGALSTVWGSWDDFYNINVLGSINIAQLCVEHGVKKLVYVSSPSIYTTNADRFNIKEDEFDSNNELNYYIKSKIMAEKQLKEFLNKGTEIITIRPRGLIGPEDTSLVPRILAANKKIGIPLFNNGKNIVDITCVENVAYACRLCIYTDGIDGEVFNISNGEPMEFKTILEKFLQAINEQPKYLTLPFNLVYSIAVLLENIYKKQNKTKEPPLTKYTVCTLGFSQTLNIEKAKKLLGYKTIIKLEDGIINYGKWKSNNNWSLFI